MGKDRTPSEQKAFKDGQRDEKSGATNSTSRIVHNSVMPGDHLSKGDRAAYNEGVASVRNNKK